MASVTHGSDGHPEHQAEERASLCGCRGFGSVVGCELARGGCIG